MTKTLHTIIGLPQSGKTTFLAALWHLLSSHELETMLELDLHVGDHRHLDRIVDLWEQCRPVDRTPIGDEQDVTLYLKDAQGEQMTLSFPDLSGESFENQINQRTCNPDYVERCNNNGGLLLFVTVDKATDGIEITDAAALSDKENLAKPKTVKPWSHNMLPQQVSLVELLQFIQKHPFSPKKRKLAVIVSAWDLVEASGIEPHEWIEREMPLLHQFLSSNPQSFEIKIYGVSAQGGTMQEESRKQLLAKHTASERIRCVGGEANIHDLTAPIAWLSEKAPCEGSNG